MEQNIKIFEATTVRQAFQDCFAAGFRPATIQEVWKLKKAKKILSRWYDAGTLWVDGDFRQATVTDDLEKIYS